MEAVLTSFHNTKTLWSNVQCLFPQPPPPFQKTKITDVPFPDCSAVGDSNRYLSENGTN